MQRDMQVQQIQQISIEKKSLKYTEGTKKINRFQMLTDVK